LDNAILYKTATQVINELLHLQPRFELISTSGPDHLKVFKMKLTLGENKFIASANTIKAAKQKASEIALTFLKSKTLKFSLKNDEK
jgi:ribonuclease-3